MEHLWWTVPGFVMALAFRVAVEVGGLHWALRLSGTKRQRHQRYRAWKSAGRMPPITIRRTWVDDELLVAAAVALIVMGIILLLIARGDITP